MNCFKLAYLAFRTSVCSGTSLTKRLTAKGWLVSCLVVRMISLHLSTGRSPNGKEPKHPALFAAATISGEVTPNMGAWIRGYLVWSACVMLFFQFMAVVNFCYANLRTQ